jgi:hypothetical protein
VALLTKSGYIRGRQCPKLLWLSKNNPSTLTTDDIQDHIFQQGQIVGDYAQQLFPNGHLIDHNNPFMDKINQTRDLIKNHTVIFEGSFLWNGCFCMVDALVPTPLGWQLIEIKSSTQLKSIHLDDVTFQAVILTELGIPIHSHWVYVINTDYIRQGDIDIAALFKKINVSNDIQARMDDTRRRMAQLKPRLTGDCPIMPIGPHCTSPYACQAKQYCWSDVPPNAIFDMGGMPASNKFNLYYNGTLTLTQLRMDQVKTPAQKRQLGCIKENLDFIHQPKLTSFLTQLTYPLSFLDFECIQSAIPPYDGLPPYAQQPILFSLHIDTGTQVNHHSFLAPVGEDPRSLMVKALQQYIPPNGHILVYNQSFEKDILHDLSIAVPDQRDFLNTIIDRLIDLATPFKKQWVYLREFKGRHSMKTILPGLVPSLDYDQLSIGSGKSINAIYHRYTKDPTNKEMIQELHDYVSLDTYGMVKIQRQLRTFIGLTKE